jgi:hypothetical protein
MLKRFPVGLQPTGKRSGGGFIQGGSAVRPVGNSSVINRLGHQSRGRSGSRQRGECVAPSSLVAATLRYRAGAPAGQRLAKTQRIRVIANVAIESVRLRTSDGRGQLDCLASGRRGQALGMLHQPFSDTAPPCPTVDNQRRDAHDGRGVLQHPADVQCDEAQHLSIRDGEGYRIRAGQAELPDVFDCLLAETAYPSCPKRALAAAASSGVRARISIIAARRCREVRRCDPPP